MSAAYELTRERRYLRMAVGAADWPFDNTLDERGGNGWVEDVHRPLVHTSLDNGAPGIAWFLHDLARMTGNRDYERPPRVTRVGGCAASRGPTRAGSTGPSIVTAAAAGTSGTSPPGTGGRRESSRSSRGSADGASTCPARSRVSEATQVI
jgi:hypothetical protein